MTVARTSRASRSSDEHRSPPTTRLKVARVVRKRLTSRKISLSMKNIWKMPPMETVELIKRGVSPDFLTRLSRDLNRSMRYVVLTIGMAPTSASRKLARQTPLAPDESERALGMAKLIGQAESIVQQSGNPAGFDAGKWVADWIETPQPALGGHRPDELLDTAEGQRMISDLLARMQSGAYS